MGITKKRGVIIQSRVWSNNKTYNVFPMLHPSYCLRNKGIEEMEEDIQKLAEIIKNIKQKIC